MYKILAHKEIKELYGKYFGDGEIVSSSTPHLYPRDFSIEKLKKYVKDIEGIDLRCGNWFVLDVEINVL